MGNFCGVTDLSLCIPVCLLSNFLSYISSFLHALVFLPVYAHLVNVIIVHNCSYHDYYLFLYPCPLFYSFFVLFVFLSLISYSCFSYSFMLHLRQLVSIIAFLSLPSSPPAILSSITHNSPLVRPRPPSLLLISPFSPLDQTSFSVSYHSSLLNFTFPPPALSFSPFSLH